MSVAELRQKDTSELKQELDGLLRKQFKLRLLKASGELKQNHQFKVVRRAIARIITLISEKEGGKI